MKQKIKTKFPAMQSKNFRLFWVGQCISLTGTWMQTTALSWLVYEISNSPFLSGLVLAIGGIPFFLFSVAGGIILDKFSDKKVLVDTQIVLIAASMVLAALIGLNSIKYYHLVLFSLITGAANAVNLPARQTFIYHLVGKDALTNGIALNSVAFNGARIIGPAFVGILMGFVNISICFWINAFCFIPVTIFVCTIKTDVKEPTENKKAVKEITEAFSYIRSKKILLRTLLISTVIGLLAMNYNVLTPVLAKSVNGHSADYSFLISFMGIGSLIGAVFMSVKNDTRFVKRLLLILPIVTSVLFVLIGAFKNFIVFAFLYIFYGFCITAFATASNSVVLLESENEMRGRVVSSYTMLFNGMNYVGSILGGYLTGWVGIFNCFKILGVAIFASIGIIQGTVKNLRKVNVCKESESQHLTRSENMGGYVMNNQICYFEKPGKSNTENVFKIVKEYAFVHHVNEIVLASTTGQTALLAADYFHDLGMKIIAVGVDTFGWSQSEETKNELRKRQIQAVPCVHFFEQDTANALRSFSQGTKVAFEIAETAMENDLLSDISQIIAIGGTGFGSDTALVLKSNGKQNPKFDVIRILCMPEAKQLDEKERKNVF